MTAISALPTPPSRQDPSNFSDRADAFVAALPNFVTEANALSLDVNAKSNAATNAAAAAASSSADATHAAQAAMAVSNFLGPWSALSGPLSPPASVSHSGSVWVLLSPLANVAAAMPGVSSSWSNVSPATGLGSAAYRPAGDFQSSSTVGGDVLLGRAGAPGAVQEIPCTAAARALLDDADAAAQRSTLGLTSAATTAMGTGPGQIPVAEQIPLLVPGAAVVGMFRNLMIDSLGVNNYNCTVVADEVVLEDSSNRYLTVRAVNKTVDASRAVGAPLSIMQARTASTWLYPWLWYNQTNGLTATLDASSTVPTAPAGYLSSDYKAMLPGARRTDSSGGAYLMPMRTRGKRTQYVVTPGSSVANMPIMASGAAGNTSAPTWAAVGVNSFVPPVASKLSISVQTGSLANQPVIVAPNNAYGGRLSVTNPPYFAHYPSMQGNVSVFDMILESSNIYWACDYASVICCNGWEDNI